MSLFVVQNYQKIIPTKKSFVTEKLEKHINIEKYIAEVLLIYNYKQEFFSPIIFFSNCKTILKFFPRWPALYPPPPPAKIPFLWLSLPSGMICMPVLSWLSISLWSPVSRPEIGVIETNGRIESSSNRLGYILWPPEKYQPPLGILSCFSGLFLTVIRAYIIQVNEMRTLSFFSSLSFLFFFLQKIFLVCFEMAQNV